MLQRTAPRSPRCSRALILAALPATVRCRVAVCRQRLPSYSSRRAVACLRLAAAPSRPALRQLHQHGEGRRGCSGGGGLQAFHRLGRWSCDSARPCRFRPACMPSLSGALGCATLQEADKAAQLACMLYVQNACELPSRIFRQGAIPRRNCIWVAQSSTRLLLRLWCRSVGCNCAQAVRWSSPALCACVLHRTDTAHFCAKDCSNTKHTRQFAGPVMAGACRQSTSRPPNVFLHFTPLTFCCLSLKERYILMWFYSMSQTPDSLLQAASCVAAPCVQKGASLLASSQRIRLPMNAAGQPGPQGGSEARAQQSCVIMTLHWSKAFGCSARCLICRSRVISAIPIWNRFEPSSLCDAVVSCHRPCRCASNV